MTDLIRFSGRCEIEAAGAGDAKPRRLIVRAYDGKPMTVSGFGAVVVDLQGMELPSSVPVLANHANELDSLIGQGTPRVEHGSLVLSVTVAPGAAGERVVQLLEANIALEASIGADPIQRRFLRANEEATVNGSKIVAPANGISIIERARLRETSILPVGANVGTSVALAATFQRGLPMSEIDSALQAERQRVKAINSAAKNIGDLPPAMQQRANDLHQRALDGEIDLPTFQSGMLDALRASRAMPTFYAPPGRSYADDRHIVEACLMLRAGREKLALSSYGEQAIEAARRLPDRSFMGLARKAVEIGGHDSHGMTPDSMLRASGPSSYSLPVALSNVGGKVLLDAYQQSPATWRSFAKIVSAASFKEQSAVRPSAMTNLAEVAGGGEIKHGTISESVFTWQLGQYARLLMVDRKDLVNDDLSLFDSVLPGMATAASRTLSDLVWQVIFANAGSFFDETTHSNDMTTGSALASGSLATAISKMRKQRDDEGNDLDIRPEVLCVPPELQVTATALLASEQILPSAGLPTGNALKNAVMLEVEPRLSNSTKYSSATAANWHLFAGPNAVPVVVGFLNGMQSPSIETLDPGPDRLGMVMRCVFDFGSSLGDYRAAVRASGAA